MVIRPSATSKNQSSSSCFCMLCHHVTGQCSAGSYKDDTSDTCRLCEVGKYQPFFLQDTCLDCPPGTNTAGPGAKQLADCISRSLLFTYKLYHFMHHYHKYHLISPFVSLQWQENNGGKYQISFTMINKNLGV